MLQDKLILLNKDKNLHKNKQFSNELLSKKLFIVNQDQFLLIRMLILKNLYNKNHKQKL